jgi:TusA-related sulfurtransferase
VTGERGQPAQRDPDAVGDHLAQREPDESSDHGGRRDDARREEERRRLEEPARVRVPGVVDARGLRCPAPIILLARVARDAAGGEIEVWWTDPAARTDIAAWARMRGHEVLGTEPLAGGDDAATSSSDEPAYATRVCLTRGA